MPVKICVPKVTIEYFGTKRVVATEPVGILFPKILLSISEQIVFHAKLYNGRQQCQWKFCSQSAGLRVFTNN